MNRTRSPLQWRVLLGGIAGLVGVGVIGVALAFPSVTDLEALPDVTATSTPSVSVRPTAAESAVAAPTASAPSASPRPSTVVINLDSPPPTTPPAEPEPEPEPEPSVTQLTESAPTSIRIPSLDVDAPTVTLGLVGNALETPSDPEEVGWFTGANTPGGPGRAVMAGHLTWNGRHTVFARLPDVAVGAVVEVDREDGTTAQFKISRVATFDKNQFPTAEVYASTDEPSLVLITCGGEYSSSEHSYDSNVIAYATAL